MRRVVVFAVCVLATASLLSSASPAGEDFLLVADRRRFLHLFSQTGGRPLRSLDLGFRQTPRGLCVDAARSRFYLSAGSEVSCWSWPEGRHVWSVSLDAQPADRFELSPDGRTLYVPSGFVRAQGALYVLDAATGQLRQAATHEAPGRAHNAQLSDDGRTLFLSGRASPFMVSYPVLANGQLADEPHRIGPFAAPVRPFVRGGGKIYANVDNLLGYQIADEATGQVLDTVQDEKAAKLHAPHHECPSHGLALTPDGGEVWVVDSEGDRLLVHSTRPDHALLATLPVGFDPGWMQFSPDGARAYPSSGEVIDCRARKVVGELQTPAGERLSSEKIVPVRLDPAGRLLWAGRQWGLPQAAPSR